MFKIKYLFIILLLLQGCAKAPVYFEKASISSLPNWKEQNFEQMHNGLLKNCSVIIRKKGEYLHSNKLFGRLESWRDICSELSVSSYNNTKDFFKNNFQVYKVKSDKKSLFTGYYTPTIKGSLVKTKRFNTALYEKPTDLYSADLGAFYPELKGKKIIARLDEKNKRFKPYYKRNEMGLAAAKPFVWLESPIDSFFLHIQGSGYIELENEDVMHVAYGGSNGHIYKAIGRTLIKKGWMKKEEITMQSLYLWLKQHPKQQQEVFYSNPRYIFFREGNGKTKGSLGVELESESSIAVDPNYIPLGIPTFLSTTTTYNNKPLNKVMYTEDTGAAIKGGVRADIFFGKGKMAENLSGSQNSEGSLYVFVPKK